MQLASQIGCSVTSPNLLPEFYFPSPSTNCIRSNIYSIKCDLRAQIFDIKTASPNMCVVAIIVIIRYLV